MTSFVVVSTDKKKRQEYVSVFCQNQNIDMLDITVIEKEGSKNLNSIGIDEIKNLHGKIFLKPIKSEMKVVILDQAHLLTTEAQNALLKVLEEPPQHTAIILSTDSTEQLLPTILSRCQIISLTPGELELDEVEKRELENFIDNLPEMKTGEKLKKAEELAKDKDQAIEWVGKSILVLREKMLLKISEAHPAGSETNILIIKSFQNLHNLLKTTNVNPRFAIENTLLNLNS
jgi:hypothetical protein